MPVYTYTALDRLSGKQKSGILDAETVKAAKQKLKRDGLFPISVEEGEEKRRGGLLSREIDLKFFANRVGIAEVAVMTRQLATLVGAGVQVIPAMTALIEQVDNVKLKKVLSQVREKVNEGSSLGAAMRDFPRVFSDLYVNMVVAGEQSGTLDIVLLRLADFTESQLQLRNKIRSTMAYPIVTLFISVGVLFYLVTFVIPKVATIFDSMEKGLPTITVVVVAASDFLSRYWWIAMVLIAGAVYLFRRWLSTESGRRRWDGWMLKAPIIGKLVGKLAVSRFARTLSTLLKSGVPVLTALDIVKNVVNNVIIRDALEETRESISEGESIAEPLKKSGVFPPLVTHMISVGEASGEIEEMLMRVAEAYENDVDTTITGMTALMEPVMILLMGGVVAFIVMAILLPILDMTSGIAS